MNNREVQYLEFKHQETIPEVAGLLPGEVAILSHAITLSRKGERTTIAFPTGDDVGALEVISAVWVSSAYILWWILRCLITGISLRLVNDLHGESSLDWSIYLACQTRVEVILLLLVRPLPILYDQDDPLRSSVATLLTCESGCGKELRIADNQLVSSEILGTFCLRQTNWRFRFDKLENDFDMHPKICGFPELFWPSIKDNLSVKPI